VTSSVRDFYDGLAAAYHLVYGDRWDDAVAGQGAVLDRLIRDVHGDAADVLDCACGIGTQAIGLALCGHRVHGTDISQRSLDRARRVVGVHDARGQRGLRAAARRSARRLHRRRTLCAAVMPVREQASARCMDTSSRRVAAASSRMQYRQAL
jgi:SAM-dependent methyltransferase